MSGLDEEIDKLRESIQNLNNEKQKKIKVRKEEYTKEEGKKPKKQLSWNEALEKKKKLRSRLKKFYDDIEQSK